MELGMTRTDFWNYIDNANKRFNGESYEIIDYLTKLLSQKSKEEIFSFGIILDELMLESYNEKLWCASYLVNGDPKEESFDFFRLWLISQGEKTYTDVLKNPDNLIKYIENSENNDDSYLDFYENEDFFFIAVDAFGFKNNIETFENIFDDYLDAFDNFKEKINYKDTDYPKLRLTWNEKVPKSMQKVCPILFKKMYIEE